MQLNFSALQNDVTSSMIREYKRAFPLRHMEYYLLIFRGLFIGIGALLLLTAVLIWAVSLEGELSSVEQSYVYNRIAIGVFGGFGLAIIPIILIRRKLKEGVRLWHFAHDNQLAFQAIKNTSQYPGIYFKEAIHDTYTVIEGSVPTGSYEFGQFSITGGKYQKGYKVSYIRIQLAKRLPHILLDNKKNNSLFGRGATNLPAEFQKNQIVNLEGNFNDFYTLYAPVGYERDALYVFAPDLMALFIDQLVSFDAEIVDDQLFIYSGKQLPLTDETVLQRIFTIIDVVGAKTARQTERYLDEKVTALVPQVVAVQGQRLKERWVVRLIVTMVLIVSLFILMQFVF
jgi:hypothetical protein